MNTLSVTLAAAASVTILATTSLPAAANGFTSDIDLVSVTPEVQALPAHPNPLVLEAITWRPRPSSRPPARSPEPSPSPSASASESTSPTSIFQVHGGFSEHNEQTERGFLAGARLGFVPEPHVQLGVTADWIYRVQRNTASIPGEPIPGGGTTTRVEELSHVTAQRIPVQAYIEFTLAPSLGLSPHAGVGGGWHMLFLDAEDNTGAKFDAMYDGWGWQAWGGLTLRFGPSLRLIGEVFRTEANLGRTVEDENGTRYHEIADGDDIGARFGLRFGS